MMVFMDTARLLRVHEPARRQQLKYKRAVHVLSLPWRMPYSSNQVSINTTVLLMRSSLNQCNHLTYAIKFESMQLES